jgi:hypothetical protein
MLVMLGCVQVMAVGYVRMMSGFLVGPRFVMLRGLAMMLRSLVVMMRGLFVMLVD